MMDRKTIWESAGRTGLILGLASISYVVISELLGSIQSESKAVMALINVFCILIMRAAMYKFSDEYIEADNSDTLKFGMASALLSALAFSTFYLADMLFIHPDMITKAIEASQEVFGSMLDSNETPCHHVLHQPDLVYNLWMRPLGHPVAQHPTAEPVRERPRVKTKEDGHISNSTSVQRSRIAPRALRVDRQGHA